MFDTTGRKRGRETLSVEKALAGVKGFRPHEYRTALAQREIDGKTIEAYLFISPHHPNGPKANSFVKITIWVAGEIVSSDETKPMSELEAVGHYNKVVKEYGLIEKESGTD